MTHLIKIFFLLPLAFLLSCQSGEAPNSVVNQEELNGTPVGQLIFIEIDVGQQYISRYDLQSQTVERIFAVPDNGWVSHIDATQDGQLLMAYAPPPSQGEIQFGYTSLYLTAQDDTAVSTELIQKEQQEAVLFNPILSPSGDQIYFSYVSPDKDNVQFSLDLRRLDRQSGQVSIITKDAIWPRLSADGEKVVYVSVNPESLGDALWLADADGRNAKSILNSDMFQAVDVPMFSPDGRWIYFSAAKATNITWWERLLGVQIAAAHDIPSDWYRIPVNGGRPEQLTTISETGLYGAFSPDGQFIAFATFNGLYLMRPDGSSVEKILEVGATSSLSWIEEGRSNSGN